MDLTNIKPCVECTFYGIKCDPANFCYSDWDKRIYRLFVKGEDCFEEVKSNAEV